MIRFEPLHMLIHYVFFFRLCCRLPWRFIVLPQHFNINTITTHPVGCVGMYSTRIHYSGCFNASCMTVRKALAFRHVCTRNATIIFILQPYVHGHSTVVMQYLKPFPGRKVLLVLSQVHLMDEGV